MAIVNISVSILRLNQTESAEGATELGRVILGFGAYN